MRNSAIYENIIMTGCFNRMKALRNGWSDERKNYGLATIMDICGDDYRSYSFVMERCESIIAEMIPYLIMELLKDYGYRTRWYKVNREDAHVYSVKDDVDWKEYVGQHNKKRVFAFSCDDESHRGILYVFKDYGIGNQLPGTLLDTIISENELKYHCYISLVEDEAYSEVLNHNNNENDPSRGTGIFSLRRVFESFFEEDEYAGFKQYAETFTNRVRDYFGFEIVKTLKPNTLHNFRKTVRDELYTLDYYQGEEGGLEEGQYRKIRENFIENKNCELLTGSSDFAQSYMTAEWLFSSLTEVGNIDLTAIAMGYFKSIEQLLFYFIKQHTREKDGVSRNVFVGKNKPYSDDRGYADLTDGLMDDEDKTKDINLGALTGFFGFYNENTDRYYHRNKDLLISGINDNTYEYIIDTLTGIVGLRNGYFHKHNLSGPDAWKKVINARNNARKVFFLILGAYKISDNDKEELGFIHVDDHDDYYKLCEYMNRKAYEKGVMTSTGVDTPIYYLNGQTDPYGFWTLHQDDFIEYDDYGEPIFSGIYFGQLGNNQQFQKATRNNLPTEIWEGVLTISKSVPIEIKPSGPRHMIYKDGKFMI